MSIHLAAALLGTNLGIAGIYLERTDSNEIIKAVYRESCATASSQARNRVSALRRSHLSRLPARTHGSAWLAALDTHGKEKRG